MPRRQKPEKLVSSDEKIKGNALYFLQGKEVELETFDVQSYLNSLGSLPAEDIIKHLKQLASERFVPKMNIITVSEDGTERKHLNVTMFPTAQPGRYRMTVPDLYPRDGAPKYLICGTVHVEQSFTKAVHDRWEAFSEERKLPENLAEQSRVRREVRALIPTNEEIRSIRDQIPELRDAHEQLSKKQAKMFTDLDVDDQELERVSKRLRALSTHIAALENEVRTWESSNDTFETALKTSGQQKRLQELSDEANLIFLEFVHQLSVEQGKTDEDFEAWKARATADDYANATRVVSVGNEFWTFGAAARPLAREDEQRMEYERTLN